MRFDRDTVGATAYWFDMNGGSVSGSYTSVAISEFKNAVQIVAGITALTYALVSF